MSLNLSWMVSGLADWVQSQTHFMFSLPLVPPVQLSHQTGLSCSCSHSFLLQDLSWSRTIFGKTLRLIFFASLLSSVYCKTFFLPSPRETDSRSKPFYSLQKRALLYFMVTEPQINLNWYNSVLFFFPHFLFSYFNFHNPQPLFPVILFVVPKMQNQYLNIT